MVVVMLGALITSLSGCASLPGQLAPSQTINQATPASPTLAVSGDDNSPVVLVDGGPIAISSLEQLISSDLIIEGKIKTEKTLFVPDTTATNAELADRQARGLPIGVDVTTYEVAVDKVLKGAIESANITVDLSYIRHVYSNGDLHNNPTPPQVGDRVILALADISVDPTRAPDQAKYRVLASSGQFRIEKDDTLSSYIPEEHNPIADTYRGKDKNVLEKDIQDLVAKMPKPSKADVLQQTLQSSGIVIIGTVQGARDVHFVNSSEKSQKEIDQLLAEGKMPGLLLTDYAVTVDKVLYDMRGDNPRFFPDWKPLEPGQTIIVTRQGGTYKGVTKLEEAGPVFEAGQQEVLFLGNFSLTNYDLPDDGQARYSTDARLGRLLIGKDGNLAAFTPRGVGGLFGGQSVEQLEKDLAEFLKAQSANQMNPAPSQP
jgi:hypothetical protein